MSKVVLLGNTNSGKTVTCRKFLPNSTSTIKPTIGAELYVIGKYQIWDTAGRCNFGGLRDAYYIQADIALLFEGGEEPYTNWEVDMRRVSPNVAIYRLSGSLDSKYTQMTHILNL
jgi:GTP-binding nuclear protein Ran